MSHTILLYGATGFSGRLIAAEGERTGMATIDGMAEARMILAGRDGTELRDLADQYGMESRIFGLDDRDDVRRGLRDVDVVVNAAGPFARTAERLAQKALDADCHYIDINGEIDVYKKLDDLDREFTQRGRAIVCSAGHTAAASDLLLNAALSELETRADLDYGRDLGAVRIAMSRIVNLSRGSMETLWRLLREQVTVVRTLETPTADRGLKLWHEPVGKLERTFDFRKHGGGNGTSERDLRIASAANLVDTLTARLTVWRKKFSVKRIESYVEAGTAARLGYQLGAFVAPVATIPWVSALARQQIAWLPRGPSEDELRDDRQIVLLEIEDPGRTTIIDWRWETPNAYQFTAQVVVEIAKETAKGQFGGLRTPGAVLGLGKERLTSNEGALRGCRLNDRLEARRREETA